MRISLYHIHMATIITYESDLKDQIWTSLEIDKIFKQIVEKQQ